jgi:hypothetical protein
LIECWSQAQLRTFCKEKNVVLMPIRICDERSKSVKPTKPSGIFIAQTSCIFQCSGSARPRVSEIVVNSRKT